MFGDTERGRTEGRLSMTAIPRRFAVAASLTLAFATLTAGIPTAQASGVGLVAHRAVYDLRLAKSRGKRVEAVRGRILYDFSGNACDGFALQFRQVSELDSGEGKVMLSDLRAATWEDGSGKSFRFNSQNFVNEKPVDTVDGKADHGDTAIVVKLAKPTDKSFDLEAAFVFPTEHMRRIIAAAEAGKSLLEVPVYDGSDSGEKLYNSLTVIGREILPDQRLPTDAAAGLAALAGMKRWPVTISYFDRKAKGGGEQTPVYAIGFELYENGISRALSLDYGDFVVAGDMSQLEIKDASACK
jgi:hypothetical protein